MFKLSREGNLVMKKYFLIFVLVLSIGFPLAYGHPFTSSTNPPQASSVPTGITQVSVTYSEAVEIDFSVLKVFDSNGEQIDNRDTKYLDDEESLVVTTPPLEDGVYTVTSKVLSKIDGHLVDYAFVFGVGEVVIDPELIQQQGASENLFYPEAGARFPGLVGQTIVLGCVISSLLIWNRQKSELISEKLSILQEKFHNKFSAITGIGLIAVFSSNILMLIMATLRLEASPLDVIQTSFGTTWVVRMGITIALLGIWFWIDRSNSISKINQIPLLILSLALIATTTMIGHSAASEQPAAIVLDYVHNLLSSVWIGGIIFFAFILLPTFSKLDDIKKELFALQAIPRFSIMIIISLGILIITGPTLLWFLESNVGLLVESTYGMLILAKIAIASGMIAMGGYKQFRIQKKAEENIKSNSISVYKKLKQSLKIETVLGIALLGVVALLTNGSLPAGEVQEAQAQEITFGLKTVEFSENAKFDLNIEPFSTGQNTISVSVSDFDSNQLADLAELKIKISNPQRNISPIIIPVTTIEDKSTITYVGDATFGFSGKWQIEIEAQRTENVNEIVTLDLVIKPKLTQLRTDLTEIDFPVDAAPLYPVYDGDNTLWISDPSNPRLWKFTLDEQQFESFEFEGMTSITLTQDNEGMIWFTDTPNNKIGFLNPETEQIETISLPTESIPISLQADLDNNIWVSLFDKNMLLKYNQDSGIFDEYPIPTPEGGPFALLRDSSGNIWFTESSASKIGVINPESGKIREFMPASPIESPEALYFDSEGTLWITAHTGLSLVKFNTVLETFERISVPDPQSLPFGMIEDRYGNIWFAQHAIDKIGVYDPHNDNLIEIQVPTETSFVQFITKDNKENIWFVEQQGNKLGQIKISEVPSLGITDAQTKAEIKYTELVSPLISMGIIATSLFFVKSVKDKRRIDSLIQ